MLRSSDAHHYQKQQEQRREEELTLKRGRQVVWKLEEGDSFEKTVQTMNYHRLQSQSPSPSPQHQQQQPLGREQEQDHKERSSNQSSGEHQTGSNKPKRNPFCSRCRNHGKSAQVKGHKRHCEYRSCQCEGCKLVECRQIVSAAQIKRRRYQKQDEECGRRIEISPPVLVREPSNDPAALIAKTLIGSASAKHVQHQQHPQQHPQHHQLSAIHSASAAAASAASSVANSAFHLFHFPSSVLSAAAASLSRPHAPSPASGPSAREQIILVEEFHQTFGPLAIYAWLRSEQFDLHKVRDLIELSRASFDELLQITGHSPLDLTSPIVD